MIGEHYGNPSRLHNMKPRVCENVINPERGKVAHEAGGEAEKGLPQSKIL